MKAPITFKLRVWLYIKYILKEPFIYLVQLLGELNRPTIWFYVWIGLLVYKTRLLTVQLTKFETTIAFTILIIIHLWRKWLIGDHIREYREQE